VEIQIEALRKAIEAQEELRPALGDAIVDETIAALREKIEALSPASTQERKLVTCLFCDVVGSTKMAASRDPEEVLGIIDSALQLMNEAVQDYGGTISRYTGDGVLALFGAPQAIEQHAERAIRAGLAIQEQMAGYAGEVEAGHGLAGFRVRVGINSGYVVAGRIAGGLGEYTVIGDAINVASRLEAAAPPGGILIGQSTYRLARAAEIFEVEAQEAVVVKEGDAPIAAYKVTGISAGRNQVGGALAQATLIGREGELERLKEGLRATLDGKGLQINSVVGPAGSGKTRLGQEFRVWVKQRYPEAQIWLGRAFSYEQGTPFWLAGDLLRSAMAIDESDSARRRRTKLEKSVEQAGGLGVDNLHGLAAILAVDYENDSLAGLPDQSRRRAIFDAFAAYCGRQADINPLILILEDGHWIDDPSQDLLDHLIKSSAIATLFMLILSRPESQIIARQRYVWNELNHGRYTEIILRELSREQTGQLLNSLLDTDRVPDWLVSAVAERAQGNPFFVEEIVNTLIADGILHLEEGTWRMSGNEARFQVPGTVQEVLAARIDRLDPGTKSVLQHAAIIGRTFWQRLLADMLQSDVEQRLERLSELAFIHRLGRATLINDWEWSFRHVLVQEVAYESVLKETRRRIHGRVGDWLAGNGTDRSEQLAPTLARHYTLGERWEDAIRYLVIAGDRSRALFALDEALRFYDQAQALIADHPDSTTPDVSLDIGLKQGEARGQRGEFERAVVDLAGALELARQTGQGKREQEILVTMGMIYRRTDDYENALPLLREALAVARALKTPAAVADVLYHLGTVLWGQGQNWQAMNHHQEALAICQAEGLGGLVTVQALHGLGEAYWMDGRPDLAIDLYERSLDLAREMGDRSYEAENMLMISVASSVSEGVADLQRGRKIVLEAVAICRVAHLDWHLATALPMAGQLLREDGQYEAALIHFEEGIALCQALGAPRLQSIAMSEKARLYLDLNQWEMAEPLLSEALAIGEKGGHNLFTPRIAAYLALTRLRLGSRELEGRLAKITNAARKRGQGLHLLPCLEVRAEFHLAGGRYSAALEALAEPLALAERGNLRGAQAKALRQHGLARLAMGEEGGAAADLKQSLALAETVGSPIPIFDAHRALVQLYRAQGQESLVDKHANAGREIVAGLAENLSDQTLLQRLTIP